MLCQLSYPGMASDDSKARTRPMIRRWVVAQRVPDVDAAVLVLVPADRRVGLGPVRLAELDERDAGHARTSTRARRRCPGPRAGTREHGGETRRCRRSGAATRSRTGPSPGSVLAKTTLRSVFAPLPGVQRRRRPRGTRCSSRTPIRSRPRSLQLLDLAELRLVEWMRPSLRAVPPRRRRERDVPHPEGDGRLVDAELVGDLLEGSVLGAESSGLFLFLGLAAVAHGRSVGERVFDDQRAYGG